MIWSKDIKFLCQRYQEQENYIESVMRDAVSKKIDMSRSLELISQAMKQHEFFRIKILHFFEDEFPVGSSVQFAPLDGYAETDPWTITEVFVNKQQLHVEGTNNCKVFAPISDSYTILEALKLKPCGGGELTA